MLATTRSGVTLVELIVALALLGLLAAVVGISIPRTPTPVVEDHAARTIAAARQTAIASGHTTTVAVTINGAPHSVTALPDGLIIADSSLMIDPLSGGPITERPTNLASDAASR